MKLRGLAVLGARSAGVALSYILVIRVGRTFTIAETGLIIFALNSIQFTASLGRLGSDIPLLRVVSQWPNTPVRSVVAAVTKRSTQLTIAGSSGLALGWFLWVRADTAWTSAEQLAVVPFAVAMVPLSLAMLSVEILNGRGRTEKGSFLQSGWFPMVLLASLLIFQPTTAMQVGWLALGSAAAVLAYTIPTLRSSWSTQSAHTSLPSGFGRSSLQTFATELIRILTLWVPAAVLSRSADLDQLGLFSASLRIAMVQNLVAVVVRNILAPRYARSLVETDSGLGVHLARVSLMLGSVGAVGVGAVWLGADLLLGTVGVGFEAGRNSLLLLSLGFALRTTAVPSMTYLAMTHGESKVVASACLGLIALVLTLVGFGDGSATSSALGILFAFMAQFFAAIWLAQQRLLSQGQRRDAPLPDHLKEVSRSSD